MCVTLISSLSQSLSADRKELGVGGGGVRGVTEWKEETEECGGGKTERRTESQAAE